MPSTINLLRMLADPTRLRLLLLLEQEELSVAELQQILGMGQSSISSHLAQLKRAGVVEDGRVRVEAGEGARLQKSRVPARRFGRSANCEGKRRSRAVESGVASCDQTGARDRVGPSNSEKERPDRCARFAQSQF